MYSTTGSSCRRSGGHRRHWSTAPGVGHRAGWMHNSILDQLGRPSGRSRVNQLAVRCAKNGGLASGCDGGGRLNVSKQTLFLIVQRCRSRDHAGPSIRCPADSLPDQCIHFRLNEARNNIAQFANDLGRYARISGPIWNKPQRMARASRVSRLGDHVLGLRRHRRSTVPVQHRMILEVAV